MPTQELSGTTALVTGARQGVDIPAFLDGFGPPLTPEQARALGLLASSSHRRSAGWRVIGLAPGHIPAAAPSIARPAHAAKVPAMSSHATGFP